MTLIFLRLPLASGSKKPTLPGSTCSSTPGSPSTIGTVADFLPKPSCCTANRVQRRVRHVDALTPQQLADLRQTHVILELVGDQRSLAFTLPPRVAVLVQRRLLELGQYLAQSRVRQLLRAGTGDDAVRLADLEIAAHSLRIHAELRGDPLLGDPEGPLP
jgi:hypothetical protein